MAVKRLSAELLLEFSVAALRNEIPETLSGEARASYFRVIEAIGIAHREMVLDIEAPAWSLLDDLYEPGEGSVASLANDIRSGTVSEQKNPGLGKRLLKLLEAEIDVLEPAVQRLP